jgi:hypothetical protein
MRAKIPSRRGDAAPRGTPPDAPSDRSRMCIETSLPGAAGRGRHNFPSSQRRGCRPRACPMKGGCTE